MNLTENQRLALRTNIDNTPAALALHQIGDLQGLADYYNTATATIVWRTAVTQDEIMQNGFDWVRVDNLSVGKARIWEWLFDNATRTINPSKANVRSGIDETWKGTQADLDVRAAVYVHCKRAATRLEALFATGSGTSGSPSVMAIEGVAPYTVFMGV